MLLCGHGLQRRVGLQVVLQVFQVGHAAQDGQYACRCPGKTERPGGDAQLRKALFEASHDVFGHLGEASSEERFHDDGGDVPFLQLGIEVVGVDIVARGIAPVEVVELYLHEVPVYPVVHGEHLVEHVLRAVEGEAQVADASCLALLHEVVYHPVLNVALAEGLDASVPDGMEEVVVDVVDLELLERPSVHGDGVLTGVVGEVGQLGGDEELVPRMPLESESGGTFGPSLYVDGGGVIVVHAVCHGVVNQFVHGVLVDDVAPLLRGRQGGPAHAAVTEEGHALACLGVGAVVHLAHGHGAGTCFIVSRTFRSASCQGRRSGGGGADADNLQEVSAGHIFFVHDLNGLRVDVAC